MIERAALRDWRNVLLAALAFAACIAIGDLLEFDDDDPPLLADYSVDR
jgi:hypothetical protein